MPINDPWPKRVPDSYDRHIADARRDGRHDEPHNWVDEHMNGNRGRKSFPASRFHEGKHIGAGPWLDLIREVNKAHDGGFGEPTSIVTTPDRGTTTETYPDYQVIHKRPGATPADSNAMDPASRTHVIPTSWRGGQHIRDAVHRLAATDPISGATKEGWQTPPNEQH